MSLNVSIFTIKMVKDQLNLATFQNLGEHFFDQEMGVDYIW
jgi:hypothetical protein